MRLVPFTVAIFAGVTLASCVTAGGRLPEAPYCAYTTVVDTVVANCHLPSYEACRREVLAGNRGYCGPNPRYVAPRR